MAFPLLIAGLLFLAARSKAAQTRKASNMVDPLMQSTGSTLHPAVTAAAASAAPVVRPIDNTPVDLPITIPFTPGNKPSLPANWLNLPDVRTLFPSGALAPGQTIDLKGGAYRLTTQLVVNQPGVTITSSGGRGMLIHQTAHTLAKNFDTGIQVTVQGDSCTISGIDFISDSPFAKYGKNSIDALAIRPAGANLNVEDCTFTDMDGGLLFDYTASDARLTDLEFFDTRSDCIYTGGSQNGIATRIKVSDGSKQEHCFRLDTNPLPPYQNSSAGWQLIDCDFVNLNGKECIAVRNAGGKDSSGNFPGTLIQGGTLTNSKFAGVRAGNVAKGGDAAAVNDAPNVTVDGVNLNITSGAAIAFDEGTNGFVVKNCTSRWYGHPFVTVNGPGCSGVVESNTLIVNGQKYNGRTVTGVALSPSDSVAVSGTVDENGNALADSSLP